MRGEACAAGVKRGEGRGNSGVRELDTRDTRGGGIGRVERGNQFKHTDQNYQIRTSQNIL